jgi:hypothetical protein
MVTSFEKKNIISFLSAERSIELSSFRNYVLIREGKMSKMYEVKFHQTLKHRCNHKFRLISTISNCMPMTVAAQSWTVFARSNSGIVCSNPTQDMDVCVHLFCVCVVLCVGSGLATGWSPAQGVLPIVCRLRNWKSGQGPTKGCRAIDRSQIVYVLRTISQLLLTWYIYEVKLWPS